MTISVIIPTYKPGDYIYECLDSLNKQSLKKDLYEVFIVLNGCKDPFEANIKDYISDFEGNWRLIQLNEAGVSNARNVGINYSKGEYITFIDDDDFISPFYLEELYKHASPKIISLCFPLSFVDGESSFEQFHITQDYIKNIDNCPCPYIKAKRFFSGPVYKLIYKDIIGDRRFNKTFKNGEDSIFMFEISDKFDKVDFTSQNAIYYRRLRNGSALLRRKNTTEIISNCARMIVAYSKIYFCHPLRYSVLFYLTRILGAIHGAMEQLKMNRNAV